MLSNILFINMPYQKWRSSSANWNK